MRLLNVFDWVATRFEQAAMTGIGRALARLDAKPANAEDPDVADPLAELQSRLALPSPTPAGESPSQSRGKRDKSSAASAA